MTCAKKQVTCYLIKNGHIVGSGTNSCANPQTVCPRLPGEGYEKCKTICQQHGHAEEMALKYSNGDVAGSHACVKGIGWYCRNCQEKLFAAGVVALRVMK